MMTTNHTGPLITWILSLVAVGGLAASEGRQAAPRAEVIFSQPEKFTDVKDDYWGRDDVRDHYLSRLREHIEKRVGSFLPADQTLAITITDVDMAGDFEPWRGHRFNDIRVVRDRYPPRINLTFTVTDNTGQVIKEGERQLRNSSFLMDRSNNDDPLRHEKQLLDQWLRDEFRRGRT